MCVAQLVRCKTSCCQNQLWLRRWLYVENKVTGGICSHHCQGRCAQLWATGSRPQLQEPCGWGEMALQRHAQDTRHVHQASLSSCALLIAHALSTPLPAPLYPHLTDLHPGNSSPEVLPGTEAAREQLSFFFLFYSRHNSSHCPLYLDYERNYLKPNS